MRYWQVAIPKPIDTLFTYSSDDDADLVGFRVVVPFGKKDQTLAGVVVSEALIPQPTDKIKPISYSIDTKPALSNELIKLIVWISDYYLCPIGETFKVAIPAGISPKTLVRFEPNRSADIAAIEQAKKNPQRAKLLNFLFSEVNSYSTDYLERSLSIPNIQYHINYLLEHNIITLNYKFVQPKTKTERIVRPCERLLKDNDFRKTTLDELDKNARKQSELLMLLLMRCKDTKSLPTSEISKVLKNPTSIITALEKKGLVEVEEVAVNRNEINQQNERKIATLSTKNEALLNLTLEQKKCVDALNTAIDSGKFSPFMLHGITGSGKTLIYIHAIKKALNNGKSVLLLVPEISLTPQLIDRFNIVFPNQIAVFHSRLSDGERYDAYNAVLNGRSKIVIGARSALFAPLQNIGLIIVDEEHEHTYKQEGTIPYYNGRDAALMRARFSEATIILGSATPSLESFYNACNGKYKLLEITERADNATLPDINLLDMNVARANEAVSGEFSRLLIDKIKERIAKKEGVILLQNKRGYSNYQSCSDCGYVPHCKHCSVTLTYHKKANELRCHYCGYVEKPIRICPDCGCKVLSLIGAGTQRIEEQLTTILENEGVQCNIVRMDYDSTRKKGTHRSILQAFNNGEADILLGTQMVAKGLDFSRVTLVGVINADIQLQLPDFRAGERTYQLLSQVAGRAGRTGERKGEVIIQTHNPDNYAILATKENNYRVFYEQELALRKEFIFPPLVRFCVIEFSGKKEELVAEKAANFYFLLSEILNRAEKEFSSSIKCYPPQQPPISKMADKYRYSISLKDSKNKDTQGQNMRLLLRRALNIYSENYADAKVSVRIDIDSYSL